MIDPKAAAGTVGGALALLVWTLLASFVEAIRDMPAETLATCVAATATIATAVLAYLTPNLASMLRKRLGEQVLEAVAAGDAAIPGAAVVARPNVEVDAIPVEAHEGATAEDLEGEVDLSSPAARA